MQLDITSLNYFMSGAIMLAFWAIAFFFQRFWSKTRDRLFLLFALAFWIMGVERIVLLMFDPTHEMRPYVYTIRLLAFLMIIFGIVDKNRPRRAP